MVGWHHQLNGHEFEQAPVDGDEQGSLACYRPWCHNESDMTERLNNKKVPLSKAMVNKWLINKWLINPHPQFSSVQLLSHV